MDAALQADEWEAEDGSRDTPDKDKLQKLVLRCVVIGDCPYRITFLYFLFAKVFGR